MSEEKTPEKEKIAVIGMARSGTTLMARALAQLPDVRMCWREIFNPNLPNRLRDVEDEGLPPPPADANNIVDRSRWFNEVVLPQLRRECVTHYGYKIVDATFVRQPDIAPLALSDPGLKVIVLTRNPVASFISNATCMADNIWRREVAEGPLPSQPPILRADWTQEWVNRTIRFWQMVTSMPWARLIVPYTELVLDYPGTMQKTCEWLGTEWNDAKLPLSRTRPEMVKDRIPDMNQLWPMIPGFWARDMYEVLAEEPHLKGPHI